VQDHERIEGPETDRRHNEQIHRGDPSGCGGRSSGSGPVKDDCAPCPSSAAREHGWHFGRDTHVSSIAQAHQQAFAWIGQQSQIQASLLAYIDVFWTLMLISDSAVPLAFVLRKVKLGAGAPIMH
jgi:hypothetical protein